MSGFVCPCCRHKSDIYRATTGGAKQMADDMKIPFLGAIPLDPALLAACDKGQSYFTLKSTLENPSSAFAPFKQIIQNVLNSTSAIRTTALTAKNQLPSPNQKNETSNSTSISTSPSTLIDETSSNELNHSLKRLKTETTTITTSET